MHDDLDELNPAIDDLDELNPAIDDPDELNPVPPGEACSCRRSRDVLSFSRTNRFYQCGHWRAR